MALNSAIAQMDETTQQNAALVEEAAAAAGSMQEQAGVLLDVVSIFKLGQETGAKANVTARPKARAATSIKQVPRLATSDRPSPRRAPLVAAGGADDWTAF